MPNTTNRLQLQLPLGVDTVSEIRNAVTSIANTLDASVLFTQGALASIPAPSLAGRRYYATDVGIELWDTGTSWVPTGTPTPIGAIMQWSLNSDPVDPDGVTRWLVMNGRAISRTTYSGLNSKYSGASYPYGTGDGSTTFNIPDARGYVLVGVDTGGLRLPNNAPVLAAVAGVETHVLTTPEMPSHNHQYFGTASTIGKTNGTDLASAVESLLLSTSAGGGLAHTNVQPFLAVNHILKVL